MSRVLIMTFVSREKHDHDRMQLLQNVGIWVAKASAVAYGASLYLNSATRLPTSCIAVNGRPPNNGDLERMISSRIKLPDRLTKSQLPPAQRHRKAAVRLLARLVALMMIDVARFPELEIRHNIPTAVPVC